MVMARDVGLSLNGFSKSPLRKPSLDIAATGVLVQDGLFASSRRWVGPCLRQLFARCFIRDLTVRQAGRCVPEPQAILTVRRLRAPSAVAQHVHRGKFPGISASARFQGGVCDRRLSEYSEPSAVASILSHGLFPPSDWLIFNLSIATRAFMDGKLCSTMVSDGLVHLPIQFDLRPSRRKPIRIRHISGPGPNLARSCARLTIDHDLVRVGLSEIEPAFVKSPAGNRRTGLPFQSRRCGARHPPDNVEEMRKQLCDPGGKEDA